MQSPDQFGNNKIESLSGGCQCGFIRYALTGPPLTFYLCHCRHCQLQSSSAFGMSFWVKRDHFRVESGKLSFWQTHGGSGAPKTCAFCDRCGSRIYHCGNKTDTQLSIKAGTIDQIDKLLPVAHIWVKSALPWVLIDESKYKVYETQPEDEELMELWQSSHPQ